jgi:hypothetical protein
MARTDQELNDQILTLMGGRAKKPRLAARGFEVGRAAMPLERLAEQGL